MCPSLSAGHLVDLSEESRQKYPPSKSQYSNGGIGRERKQVIIYMHLIYYYNDILYNIHIISYLIYLYIIYIKCRIYILYIIYQYYINI